MAEEENPKQSKKPTPSIMASNSYLKSSVSEKLLHLLSDFNYTSDSIRVLSEYVVVLVSNGKSQSEAEAELEPFLGDTTAKFVSWLWDILSKDFNDSNANKSSSDFENTTAPSSSEVDYVSANIHSQKSGSGSVPLCQFPVLSNTLAEETNEYDATALPCKSDENIRATTFAFENNLDGSLYVCSSKTKPPAEFQLPYEQHVQYGKVHRSIASFKHSQETNVGGKRLFSRAAGAAFRQNGEANDTSVKQVNECVNMKRHMLEKNSQGKAGNVWDRLGKLNENDSSVRQVNKCVNMKRQMLEKNWQGLDQNTLIRTVQDGRVDQNLSQNCNVKSYRSNGYRKRQLYDFIPTSTTSDALDHDNENSWKYTGEPENYTYMLKESDASCKSERSKSYNKCCKSGLDASGGIGPVQAQLVDMKLRLRQLETEICMLKSKPLNKDENHAIFSSFGSGDTLKEGVESRTVFVTNVHVAATRDAFRSYFARCGPITRVIKLTNPSTITQTWSAYVTFTTKESVENALALNGTSFFSRIIWVRKARKTAVKPPTCSQPGRQRNATFQQKHYHNLNMPPQKNYGYNAAVDAELSS